MLEALTTAARTVVSESFYFDIDHRSEVSLIQETQFGYLEPTVDRLHFFSVRYQHGQSLREFVTFARDVSEAAQPAWQTPPKQPGQAEQPELDESPPVYLGYVTQHPGSSKRIGRSLVSPWARATDRRSQAGGTHLLEASVVHQHVRTAVAENVNLFGVDLRAIGVPFMEQDGSLLRCAHVSAWICHYTSVLRGLSSRRTTAELHQAGNTVNTLARPYPSSGLSTRELANILRSANLPPEVLGYNELRTGRRTFSWADRNGLRIHARRFAGKRRKRQRDRMWIGENLSATICRYLNSGMPVILARHGMAHTQVVVGYLRESDIRPTAGTADDGHSDVVAFLVSDDQDGPFEIVHLTDLIREIAEPGNDADTELVVPLPSGLWMTSEAAEELGVSLLMRSVARRQERIEEWPVFDGAEEVRDRIRTRLDTVAHGFDAGDAYTVRTYASTGTDFKRSAAVRMASDPDLVAAIGMTQMPRFVWVCEAIDRKLRRGGALPSVVATVVLDATMVNSSFDESDDGSVLEPLFLHLPGHYFAPPYGYPEIQVDDRNEPERVDTYTSHSEEEDEESDNEEEDDTPATAEADAWWRRTEIEPYFTGRWSHERISAASATHVAGFSKSARSAR